MPCTRVVQLDHVGRSSLSWFKSFLIRSAGDTFKTCVSLAVGMMFGDGGLGFSMMLGPGGSLFFGGGQSAKSDVGVDFDAYMAAHGEEFNGTMFGPVEEDQPVWNGRKLRVLPVAGGGWVKAEVKDLWQCNMVTHTHTPTHHLPSRWVSIPRMSIPRMSI